MPNVFEEMQSYANDTISTFNTLGVPTPKVEWYNVIGFLQIEDWAGLKQYAETKLSGIDGKLQAYLPEQQTINSFIDRYYEQRPELEVQYNSVDTTTLLAEESIATLLDDGLFTNETIEQYVDFVNHVFASGNFEGYFNMGKKTLEGAVKGLSLQYRQGLTTRSFIQTALHIANFNLDLGGTDNQDPDSAYYYYRNELESKLGQLKAAMDADLGASAADQVDAITGWLSGVIENKILPIINSLYQQRVDSPSVAVERDLLRISKLYKLFNNYHACLPILAFSLRWNIQLEYYQEFFTSYLVNASNLNVNLPNFSGSETAINSLANNPNDYMHQEVIVRGRVVDKDTSTEGEEQVSVLTLADEDGNQVKALTRYMHIDTQGIPIDAFVELAGIFLADGTDYFTEPVIKITREGLGGYVSSSFDSWFRFLTRDIYIMHPNNLKVSPTFEKGSDGIAFLLINDSLSKIYSFNDRQAVFSGFWTRYRD